MTIQILFIQGGGEGTHDQWDSKLVVSLGSELGRDCEIRYPLMPNEADPRYPSWKAALAKELAGLREGAIAIGHPLGCSGARLATTLIHQMARTGASRGIASLCVGVGQGLATVFERE